MIAFLLFSLTMYGPLVEGPRVTVGRPRDGVWWATGQVERQGTILLLWTAPDGRKAYGQYLRNQDSLDGWWAWIDEAEFDPEGCLGGEVHRETISVRRP